MSILNAAKSLVGMEEQRTLSVMSANTRIGIPVSRNVWWKAEILRENFLQSNFNLLSNQDEDFDQSQLELLSLFLRFVFVSLSMCI